VKYETVIGIIGKTHGVNNDSAPIVIASHMNPEIGWLLISLSAVLVIAALFELAGAASVLENATDELVSTFVFAFARMFAFALRLAGEVIANGLGVALGLGVGEAAAPAAVTVTDAASGTVFGGRHTVSLQTW